MQTKSSSATIQIAAATATGPLAGTELGINLSWVNDWGDQDGTFVNVMKNARGFAQVADYWDPTGYPVPVDSNGWPTTDFGVTFLSTAPDPLGRPLSVTAPSQLGTYHLSFTGTATVTSPDCTVQNVVFNAATNTTTADVVAGATSTTVSVVFTNTNHGVRNVVLNRPGYPIGTTQVFTNAFLNALAPFSTLRTMDFTETNANPVTSWAQRTSASDPVQSGPAGVAWEYVIQLANATGKDIWINIPEGVNLNDTSSSNYVTQLATLLKATLNPGIHVYVEYSNELWNGLFQQSQDNLTAAQNAVSSGSDKALNYDGVNNEYYYANRLAAEQTVKISQLFGKVYGSAAINTTIRPVLPSQYVQPYFIEDDLAYIQANFGAPKNYLYAVGGAPYVSATDYSSVNNLYTSLNASLTSTTAGFKGPAYTGGVDYSVSSYKSVADYYGLKTVAYEGGPDFGSGSTSPVAEQALSDPRLNQMVQKELSTWYADGNGLFMYYELASGPGNGYGAYEDLTLPTQKSTALTTVSSTPLSNYTGTTTLPVVVTEKLSSDTGISNTDLITAIAALTGTADATALITLSENGAKLGTTTANASGVWNWTPTALVNGLHTIVASETNLAGATGTASLSFTLEATAPKITKVTTTPRYGDVGTGRAVTLRLSLSEAVTVTGVPVLLLNDGGTAKYIAGSGTSTLAFKYTVAAGQNTNSLAVAGTSLPSGAFIMDAAGNEANLSGALSSPNGRLIVDTIRTRTNIANGTGQTVNAGTGSDVVVLSAGQATLNFQGSNNIAFLGGGAGAVTATINDSSSGLGIFVVNAGNDVFKGFGSDRSAVIDLLGGVGGYTTVAGVVAALATDGAGGTKLTLGSGQAIDFPNVAMGTLNSNNFRIG